MIILKNDTDRFDEKVENYFLHLNKFISEIESKILEISKKREILKQELNKLRENSSIVSEIDINEEDLRSWINELTNKFNHFYLIYQDDIEMLSNMSIQNKEICLFLKNKSLINDYQFRYTIVFLDLEKEYNKNIIQQLLDKNIVAEDFLNNNLRYNSFVYKTREELYKEYLENEFLLDIDLFSIEKELSILENKLSNKLNVLNNYYDKYILKIGLGNNLLEDSFNIIKEKS